MIIAIDVHYFEQGATAAAVEFSEWTATEPSATYVSSIEEVEPYIPGAFYKRELPCILRLLNQHALHPKCIVIDGFVYLDGVRTAGLGRHLYDALNADVEIVGVAKTHYDGIDDRCEVLRGESMRPLYDTSVGMDTVRAKRRVATMHGDHRIPTLLRSVDQLCRGKC